MIRCAVRMADPCGPSGGDPCGAATGAVPGSSEGGAPTSPLNVGQAMSRRSLRKFPPRPEGTGPHRWREWGVLLPARRRMWTPGQLDWDLLLRASAIAVDEQILESMNLQ
jgi:hypothetical protein